MDKVLELKIGNDAKETVTLRVNDLKETITDLEIQTGIANIAASGVFAKGMGVLNIPLSARIIETSYREFEI